MEAKDILYEVEKERLEYAYKLYALWHWVENVDHDSSLKHRVKEVSNQYKKLIEPYLERDLSLSNQLSDAFWVRGLSFNTSMQLHSLVKQLAENKKKLLEESHIYMNHVKNLVGPPPPEMKCVLNTEAMRGLFGDESQEQVH